METFKVAFKPQNKTVQVAKGTDLLSAAVKAGIILTAACGGEGLCEKCKVLIEKKQVLACQTIVESDLEVTVPKESLEPHERASHDAEEFTKGIVLKRETKFAFSPLVQKFYLELPQPPTDDNASDIDRLGRELAAKMAGVHVSAKLASMKHLQAVLRDSDFKITAAVADKDGVSDIITVEPGDTAKTNYGLAFDIGTTTVAGQLIDINTRRILGSRIAFNKQSRFGSDIITRIIYGSGPKGLEELSAAIRENINEIIEDLVEESEVSLADIYSATFAGNMTMMHLLLKIDPKNIRKAPYIPATTVFPAILAAEAGVEINPRGVASFFPGVTTYVGGDIVSGVLACGLAESEDISLLCDIGTNGEIVLGNKEWMIACAASAGPAFEGSGLSHGMKAVKGAIEKVRITKDLNVETGVIGNEKPKGICGSGYIDALRQMLASNVLMKDGKINRDLKTGRIRKGSSGLEFVIAFETDTATGKDIVITEDDIENLKRAKAAIYSAIISLLNKVGKELADIKKIYIAGGFGNYLNIENAVYIGLLPDTRRKAYEFIGNSSLAGARMALLSREAAACAQAIHKDITYLDLSAEPNYMDEYIAALFFPHTDLGRFPSAR